MIRNREAASNSRKKKREYMSTLEKQIAKLQKEKKAFKKAHQQTDFEIRLDVRATLDRST